MIHIKNQTIAGHNRSSEKFKDLIVTDCTLANLTLTDLTLRFSAFYDCEFSGVVFQFCDLVHSTFMRCKFTHCSFDYSNLSRIGFDYCDFICCSLSTSCLNRTGLCNVNFVRTSLPSPTQMLLCSWGEVSDGLVTDLMRYDAFCHHDPASFDTWGETGACPYYSTYYSRAAHFVQLQYLWSPGPAKSPFELMMRLFKEKNITFSPGA